MEECSEEMVECRERAPEAEEKYSFRKEALGQVAQQAANIKQQVHMWRLRAEHAADSADKMVNRLYAAEQEVKETVSRSV